MTLITESEKELQLKLDTLNSFCREKKLEINREKLNVLSSIEGINFVRLIYTLIMYALKTSDHLNTLDSQQDLETPH